MYTRSISVKIYPVMNRPLRLVESKSNSQQRQIGRCQEGRGASSPAQGCDKNSQCCPASWEVGAWPGKMLFWLKGTQRTSMASGGCWLSFWEFIESGPRKSEDQTRLLIETRGSHDGHHESAKGCFAFAGVRGVIFRRCRARGSGPIGGISQVG